MSNNRAYCDENATLFGHLNDVMTSIRDAQAYASSDGLTEENGCAQTPPPISFLRGKNAFELMQLLNTTSGEFRKFAMKQYPDYFSSSGGRRTRRSKRRSSKH